jgi:hypothetical protein
MQGLETFRKCSSRSTGSWFAFAQRWCEHIGHFQGDTLSGVVVIVHIGPSTYYHDRASLVYH